jgi:AcrR family transcriptional regulator
MNSGSKRSGGRPTQTEAEALTERILDCARLTFARKGISNSSLEEISKALAMSKHTLYRRYPNKQALLEAVVDRDLKRFRSALEEAAGIIEPPLAALRSAALRYFSFGADRDYSAFYLSVLAEAAISETLRASLAEWSFDALAPLRQMIGAAQSVGAIASGDPAEICGVLVDLIEGANNRVRLAVGESPDASEYTRQFESRWAVFCAAMTRQQD